MGANDERMFSCDVVFRFGSIFPVTALFAENLPISASEEPSGEKVSEGDESEKESAGKDERRVN